MTTTLDNGESAADPKAGGSKKGAEGEDGEKKKGGKLKLIIILVLVIAAAGGYYEFGQSKPVVYKPGQMAPNAGVDSLPQLTTSLSDGNLVQVTVAMQLSTVASVTIMTTDLPQIEDAEISIFGSETEASLLAPGGKAALKAQLLAAFRTIVGPVDKVPQINSILLTGFVLSS
jgi:flagellar basal body-associated protein FliL